MTALRKERSGISSSMSKGSLGNRVNLRWFRLVVQIRPSVATILRHWQ